MEYLPHFRLALYLLLPLFVAYVVCNRFYQVSTRSIVYWWFKNPLKSGVLVLVLLGLLFSNLIFVSGIGLVFEMAYLSAFGETHTLMYVGSISKEVDYYLPPNQIDGAVMEVLKVGMFNRTDFNDLYLSQDFIHDRGSDYAGMLVTEFNNKNVILGLFLAISAFFPLIATWHLMAKHALPTVKADSYWNKLNLRDSYSRLFSKMKLNNGMAVFLSLFFLFASFVPTITSTTVREIERAMPLPIKKNSLLHVQPLSIEKKTVTERRVDSSNRTIEREIDTGIRYIVFRVDEPFTPSIYISYKYDIDDELLRLPEIRSAIKQKITINAFITRYMTLGLDSDDNKIYVEDEEDE